MQLSHEQYQRIESVLSRQRGNVSSHNLDVSNAVLCGAEHDCKGRRLPKGFGPWHTVYTRMSR